MRGAPTRRGPMPPSRSTAAGGCSAGRARTRLRPFAGPLPARTSASSLRPLTTLRAISADAPATQAGSEPYGRGQRPRQADQPRDPRGPLHRHLWRRERSLLARRVPLAGGDVPVGRRRLAPRTAPVPGARVPPDRRRCRSAAGRRRGSRAAARTTRWLATPGRWSLEDAIVRCGSRYRLVLHHIVFQAPLTPVFIEAARLLRPGGALVAVEPGLWHPVGLGLAMANRTGLGPAVHGTPDDIPLSPPPARRRGPRRRPGEARAARGHLHVAAPAARGAAMPLQPLDPLVGSLPPRGPVRAHPDAHRPAAQHSPDMSAALGEKRPWEGTKSPREPAFPLDGTTRGEKPPATCARKAPRVLHVRSPRAAAPPRPPRRAAAVRSRGAPRASRRPRRDRRAARP